MTQEEVQPQKDELIEDRFSHFYEGGAMVPIVYEELPQGAVDYFEGKSRQYTPKDEYKERNFAAISKITHPDGTITYAAEGEQLWGDGNIGGVVYFVDYVDDTPVGHSELCFNPNMMGHEEGMAPPFVGMTRTYDENDKESEGKSFRKMGLGKRRLIEMDAYARALYDRPLDSDSLLISDGIDEEGKRTSSIRRIWEGLVGEGKAEEYTDGHGNVRYRMK